MAFHKKTWTKYSAYKILWLVLQTHQNLNTSHQWNDTKLLKFSNLHVKLIMPMWHHWRQHWVNKTFQIDCLSRVIPLHWSRCDTIETISAKQWCFYRCWMFLHHNNIESEQDHIKLNWIHSDLPMFTWAVWMGSDCVELDSRILQNGFILYYLF